MAEQSRETQLLSDIIDSIPDGGVTYDKPPQSRNEEILLSILNDTEYTKTPQSREEELLLELKEKMSGLVPPVPPVIKRVTGNPVEFTDGADAPLLKCVTEIHGSQDLHGYDKPWVGGSGKNKFDSTLMVNPASSAKWVQVTLKANTAYTVSSNIPNSYTSAYIFAIAGTDTSSVTSGTNGVGSGRPQYITTGEDGIISFGYRTNGASGSLNLDDYTYQIEEGSTATSYSPYSNICHITAYTEGEIEVSDGDGNTTTHTTTYPNAIYRGSEDVVNGTETHDMVVVDLGDLTWIRTATSDGSKYRFYVDLSATIKKPSSNTNIANLICSNYGAVSANDTYGLIDGIGVNTNGMLLIYDSTKDTMSASDFESAMSGVKLAYELATPTTTPVTPTNLPIKSLFGYNHIESSTGDMTIDYITDEYQNFVDTVESALPNTTRNLLSASKSGPKAMDIFLSLEPQEDIPDTKEEPTEEKGDTK